MRILIVGGTRFVGRHITEAALAAGHEVALLHRGKSGADLFPEATHLLADRNSDPQTGGLSVLRGTRWDATIDVSAYLPRQVSSLAEALGDNGGHYVFISSASVYADPPAAGYAEDSPVLTLPPGPIPDTVTETTYGPLKALCEEAAREHFGPSTLVIRPTYVIGPWDHSGRFTHWVQRIARGGEVLAPGPHDAPIQLIDARDLAAFALCDLSGTFHTVSPSTTWGAMFDAIAAEVAPPGTRLTWVDHAFLREQGVGEDLLPLWLESGDGRSLIDTASPEAALKAGLVIRPLAESIRDIRREDPVSGFLSPEREAQLLSGWSMLRP